MNSLTIIRTVSVTETTDRAARRAAPVDQPARHHPPPPLPGNAHGAKLQGWKFMSCSHCQDLSQFANLASDGLFTLLQPIKNQFTC